MKNKIITILCIIILIQIIAIIPYSIAKNNKENKTIYVQHDSNNDNIYLLNSEGEETTVYQIIDVVYTPCKQWTKDGLYIDDSSGKIGATSREDYIKVKENETYFVKLYGIGDIYSGEKGDEYHITSPIVYFDDKGNCVGSALTGTYSKSKEGVEIIVPTNATRMYISNYNNQSITIQKKLTLSKEEFNKIKEEQDELLNSIDSNYEKEKQDKMIYDEMDKCYITFVQDDSRPDVDKFADLFISKNIPLCFATIAENLLNNSSNLKETRLQVAQRVQDAGGEILAHNGSVITNDTINDKNFMYNYFKVQKQTLINMGLDVNGIILAGGTGQIVGDSVTAKWANSLYKYSDLLGEKYEDLKGYDSTYFHYRTALSNYKNDINKIKEDIDKAINNKEWKVFYFHDADEITEETLSEIIDYINSKGKDKVEVATYKTVYDKFAKRESAIKNDKKIYYVSNNGISKDGTNMDNPINLETLQTKKIKTGDKILFKKGETFYGTLNLSIAKTNDESVKLSCYGEGDLPTFSAYKYIQTTWEKYEDNIYRVDIKNTNNFTGYMEESRDSYNIGFLEDEQNNKYYNKKMSIEKLSNNYDFYSDGTQYLYMYLNKNPYEKLGELKAVVKTNLMVLHSNMEIDSIRFAYCGGHGIVGADDSEENIKINNCIIENIGGSYLYSDKDTRYGNGIEFYSCDARNIFVKDNIFRNIYDVGFTVQGTKGSGNNIEVCNNVFINNTQDSEIWESDSATGVVNYTFHNNISINQGRGWGYEARPDKYVAGHILFWGYNIENTDIYFCDNVVYNPRRIYFIEQTNGTDLFFKQNDYIKSNNNTYFMADDATIFRNSYKLSEKDLFVKEYNKDKNSVFNSLEVDENITKISNIENNINEIRKIFEKEHQYDDGVITKEASYETEGEKIYTCKICGNIKIEVLPKLNKIDEIGMKDEDNYDSGNNDEQQIIDRAEENNSRQELIDNINKEDSNETLIEEISNRDYTCSENKLPKTGMTCPILLWFSIAILLIIVIRFYKKSIE